MRVIIATKNILNAAFIYLLISPTVQVWAKSVLALKGATVGKISASLERSYSGKSVNSAHGKHRHMLVLSPAAPQALLRAATEGLKGKKNCTRRVAFLSRQDLRVQRQIYLGLNGISLFSVFFLFFFPPQALEDTSSWTLTHKWVVNWKTSQGECWNVFYASCPTSAGFAQEIAVKAPRLEGLP